MSSAADAAAPKTGSKILSDLVPSLPILLVAACVGILSTAFLEADDVAHYEYSRWCFQQPESILEVWGRPLVTLYYALPARLGPKAARLSSLLVGAAAALLAARLARRHGATASAFAGVATLAMPYVFVQTYAIMTELLFSVVLAFGCLLWRRAAPIAAVMTWTWLPLVRPEGFFLGIFFGVLVLFDRGVAPSLGPRLSFRRFATATCLGFGTVAWWLAGLLPYGTTTWLIDRWPKVWAADSPYGEGINHPLLFLAFLGLVATPIMLPFLVVGVRATILRGFRLEPAIIAFVVVLHGVLWTFRLFGSAGYPRYLVVLAPLLGAAIGVGIDAAVDWFGRRRSPDSRERFRRRCLVATAFLSCSVVLIWPPARPWHGDVDVKSLEAAAAWFNRVYPDPASRPFVVVDHPAFRPMVDVNPTGASCRFEPLPLAFTPVGAVAIWETKFAARYSKASRDDLARHGFEEVPSEEVAGAPPYPWNRPRGGVFSDPELENYDFGVFVRRR